MIIGGMDIACVNSGVVLVKSYKKDKYKVILQKRIYIPKKDNYYRAEEYRKYIRELCKKFPIPKSFI